jgi:hypothetical protein
MRPTPRPGGITTDELRRLPLDEFIAWVLKRRYYAVDPATGRVWNAQTGQTLRPKQNKQTRYLQVSLCGAPYLARTASVHRIVAVAVWGVDACRGMHVAHLDDNRTHDAVGNLQLMAPKPHHEYDFTSRGRLVSSQLPKTSWLPCAKCGDPDGPTLPPHKTPRRLSGARFGITGALCGRCYPVLYSAQYRANRRASANGSTRVSA